MIARVWLSLLAVAAVAALVAEAFRRRELNPVLLFHAILLSTAAVALWRRASWARTFSALVCVWLAGTLVLAGLASVANGVPQALVFVAILLVPTVGALVSMSRANA